MPEEEIDRATLWIKGRQTKEGTFKDVRVKETANKIVCTNSWTISLHKCGRKHLRKRNIRET